MSSSCRKYTVNHMDRSLYNLYQELIMIFLLFVNARVMMRRECDKTAALSYSSIAISLLRSNSPPYMNANVYDE